MNKRIQAAVAGDQEALHTLIKDHVPTAYRAAYTILRNGPDASDVAHDTMVKVIQKLGTYNSKWPFHSWVNRIARNTAIDLIRKRKRMSWTELPDSADTRPLQDDLFHQSHEARLVRAAVEELPEIYREVIDLHHFQDLKYREIAERLDVPIGTVMNRLFRARNKMKRNYLKRVA